MRIFLFSIIVCLAGFSIIIQSEAIPWTSEENIVYDIIGGTVDKITILPDGTLQVKVSLNKDGILSLDIPKKTWLLADESCNPVGTVVFVNGQEFGIIGEIDDVKQYGYTERFTIWGRTIEMKLPATAKSIEFAVVDLLMNIPTTWQLGQKCLAISKIDSPLQQFKSGIPAKYVGCKEGLQLVIKSSTGTPACLDWENGKKLLKRGWAKNASMISSSVCDSSCKEKLEVQGYACYEAAKNRNFCTNKISQRISDVVIPYSASSPDGKNYIPSSIMVSIGINNTVVWTNVDETPHIVVGDKEEFRSSIILPNQTWTFTFDKVGEYWYHGEPGPWLRGKVTALPVDMSYYKGVPLENWGGEPFLGRYLFRETDSLGYVDKVSVLNDDSVMVSLSYPNGTEKMEIELGDGFIGNCYEVNEFNNVKTYVLEEIDGEQKIAQFREELEKVNKNCNELFEEK